MDRTEQEEEEAVVVMMMVMVDLVQPTFGLSPAYFWTRSSLLLD
jgi:hypothetical protein